MAERGSLFSPRLPPTKSLCPPPLSQPPFQPPPFRPGEGTRVTVGVVVVPDLEELGGRDLHALQVALRRHDDGGGRGGGRGGGAEGGRGGGAVRGADSARGRRDGDSDGDSGDSGGSDGSSRRRPAEGYLLGPPRPATPPGAALPALRAKGGPGSPPGGCRPPLGVGREGWGPAGPPKLFWGPDAEVVVVDLPAEPSGCRLGKGAGCQLCGMVPCEVLGSPHL